MEYEYNGEKAKRSVRPDGFFMLATEQHYIRYLLEIDRGTEDNPRFLREKILPGMAYVKSQAYYDRFGHRSGRWLVITTGGRRMENMIQQAKRAETRGMYYFTTFDQINPHTLLFAPIWRRVDRDIPMPLLFIQ